MESDADDADEPDEPDADEPDEPDADDPDEPDADEPDADDPNSDRDMDGVIDTEDVFPDDPEEWEDTDDDGVGDNSDLCPEVSDPDQIDSDEDGVGDACEPPSAAISIYVTVDDQLGDVYLNGELIAERPASWDARVVYHAQVIPYLSDVEGESHVLAFESRDTGVVRAFMAAVTSDQGVLAATGLTSFKVTSADPGPGWFEPDFDDAGWALATPCSYVHSDWDRANFGFAQVAMLTGAQRLWEGDTCQSGGRSSLFVRAVFDLNPD